MKKIFGFLICTLLISVRVYAVDDIPTDKSYTFDRANVASVLAEFIEDEKKAEKAADKYNELSSNNSENAISAVDFVDVCVAGGMNMKLVDGSGYIKCLDMFMKLIEMQNLDAGGFDMYCPATGNALKSITDKTQVGDVCGGTPDTYIEYGYVTLKTDDKNGQHKYVCTCTPQSCKDGYYWNKEKHQCSVKDKDDYCVRHILGSFEYKKGKLPTDYGIGTKNNAYYNDKYAQINASADAFNRCVEYGANQGCRIRGALASVDFGSGFGNAKKYQVICNPANYEIAADKKVQEDKEKKRKAELAENMTYYEVCGKDKGKGKCVDDVFTNIFVGGTQVDPRGAAFLAEEYARVHFNDEIKCKADEEGIRRVLTDYFIKCRSVKDLSKYYEFKFDDTKESFDNVVRRNVDRAICEKIYGFKLNGTICETSKENCTGKIIPAYERYYGDGRAHAYYGKDIYAVIPDYTYKCRINHAPLFENSKLSNDFGDKLDNYAFCKNTYNQLRNDDNLINLIKEYMSSQLGINKYQIECVPASKKWPGGCSAESQNMMEFATNPSDNLISCHVGDKWVDFVFDDTHELSNKLSEVSMDAMQCVIHGHELSVKLGTELNAKNKGKKCTGLTKELCTDLDKMIRNRGGSGAHYDNKKMACIINSAKEYSTQEFWTNMGISAVVAVGSAVMVIGSGGVATPLVVGGATMLIETGINGSFYIVEELEDGQVGRRFRKFIDAAKKCKDSTCAQNVIKNHYNDLASVKEDYNYEDAAELQKELDRLFGLMEGDFCWQDQNGNILNPDSNGKCDKLVAKIYLDTEDKSLQRASIGLMIGVFVFNPESAMMKLASKGEKLLRMSGKINELETTRDRTSKILLNAARTAEQNIVKVDKLDDVGKEWYKLWQDYAPKNQTLEQFKAMANGDLDKMKQMVKSWTPRSKRPIITAQIDKQLDDINADVSRKQKIWNDLINKYDVYAIPDDPDELAQLYKQHPDLEQATKNLNYARAQQKKLEYARGYYNNTSYSTNDPEFTRTMESLIKMEPQIKIDKLKKEQKDLESESWFWGDETPEIEEIKFKKIQRIEEIDKEIEELKKSVPTQWEVAEKHQLQNLGNVVKERADDFAEIIANNPEIKTKLDPATWQKLVDAENKQADALIQQLAEDPRIKSKLSPDWQTLDPNQRRAEMVKLINIDLEAKIIAKSTNPDKELGHATTERTAVVQQILDEYAKKNPGTPVVDVYFDFLTEWGGYYTPNTNNIAFNPNGQLTVPDGMVNAMAHEHGHLIDYLAPNEGALGEQYNYYTRKIYSDRPDDGYRVALTEQSSHKIGPNVAHEATGTTNYHGEEYDLEYAKRNEKIEQHLQQVNQHNKETFDKKFVGDVAKSTLLGAGVGGVVGGTISSIIEKKNEKKDKK